MAVLVGAGANGLVLVGSCFGARAAMRATADHPALLGIVLLAPPIGDVGLGVAPRPEDLGPPFRAGFAELVRRGAAILLVYGRDDASYHDPRVATAAPQPALPVPGAGYELRVLPGQVHGLRHVEIQDQTRRLVLDWVGSVAGHVP